MKLLVDRKPKVCGDCLFVRFIDGRYYCDVLNEYIEDIDNMRLVGCPLEEHIHYNEIRMR